MVQQKAIIFIVGLLFTLVAGAFFFAYEQGLIVIDFRFNRSARSQSFFGDDLYAGRKQVVVYYSKDHKLSQDAVSIVWFKNNLSTTLIALGNAWFDLMLAEKLIDDTTTVESVALSENNKIAYLSCSRTWLKQQWSTLDKAQAVEAFLKTIKENAPEIASVVFLVKDEPMKDAHLEFEYPWPVEGVIKEWR
jgi:hypothetical protein